MKRQFEVWQYKFPERGPHSVVLISHPDLCARAKVINVLYCTSQRQSRQPYAHEVMLSNEDGFDWETFCDCSVLWSVKSDDLYGQRGFVTTERRRQIRMKIREIFLLSSMD